MYLESIQTLREEEVALQQKKEAGALAAKKALADTRTDGERIQREALERAEAEVKQLLRTVDENALTAAGARSERTEERKAALRACAERNAAKATALIVERIVNG